MGFGSRCRSSVIEFLVLQVSWSKQRIKMLIYLFNVKETYAGNNRCAGVRSNHHLPPSKNYRTTLESKRFIVGANPILDFTDGCKLRTNRAREVRKFATSDEMAPKWMYGPTNFFEVESLNDHRAGISPMTQAINVNIRAYESVSHNLRG